MRRPTFCSRPASKPLGRFGFRWFLPVFVFWTSANFALAQYVPGGTGLGGLIVADRNRTRVLREAQELIAAKKYLDAVTYLQTLLEQDEDLLLRPSANDNSGVFRSMKAEVQRTIETLPPEGREIYLRNTGPAASALLKDALEGRDDEKLAEVARLYYHTPAGYEATYRLGLKHFDHGEPMQAALILRRLQRNPEVAKRFEPSLSLRIGLSWVRAGMPNEATAAFQSLRRSGKANDVMLAGTRRVLFTDKGEPSAWLLDFINDQAAPQYSSKSDWLFAGGSANRNPIMPVPKPTDTEPWQVLTVADYKGPEDPIETQLDVTLQSVIAEQQNFRTRSAPHRLPSRQPLVVDGMVLFRMLHSVRVHDLESGDFLLEPFGYDETLDALIDPRDGEQIPNWRIYLSQLMNQRLWEDRAYGHFTSDGERLYCLMEMGLWNPIPTGRDNKVIPVSTSNVLIAYELKTGKVIWDVGGLAQPDDGQPRPLAGRYFLGPPLPLGGKLYCLADVNQEIQLNVLDAVTGALEWSQPLATPMQLTIDQDRARRASGVSVAYADGVLVCPTDVGAIVALDLTSRSLLWGFPTESGGNGNVNRNVPLLRGNRLQAVDPTTGSSLPSGWIDSTPIISGDKVVLTPLKSSKIHLLDLLTGKPIWQQPRGQGLYVGGILNNMVIVVGTKNVQTWNVHNDQTGWKEPLELSAVPTGRGVIVGSTLLLPAGKELLVVDLKTGAERKSLPVPENVELGNLVVADGRLISQGVSTLDVIAFPKLDEAQADEGK